MAAQITDVEDDDVIINVIVAVPSHLTWLQAQRLTGPSSMSCDGAISSYGPDIQCPKFSSSCTQTGGGFGFVAWTAAAVSSMAAPPVTMAPNIQPVLLSNQSPIL
jgi:hypothetical protein